MVRPAAAPPRPGSGDDASRLAAALGVVDALLFRRVSPTRWAHLGGLGRGRSWAGIIEVDEADDPLTSRIPITVGEVRRARFAESTRLLGPYYAVSGAVVRVSNDVAVVLGNPVEDLAAADDAELLHVAALLDTDIDDVLPSKRLADELEVLHTVRSLMAAPTNAGLVDTLQHLVTVATEALSCDIGVLRDGAGRLAIAPEPFGAASRPASSDWHAALDEIAALMGPSLWCLQDVSSAPTLKAVTMLPGVRSLLAVPVPPPAGGMLLMVHTAARPRGFTSQCRRLGQHVVDAGSVVAHAAALRDDLRAAADRAARAARTDPLTGLGNRLAWDEAVAAAQERVDAGATVSVVTLDVDGLKQVNDRHGHDAGDDLLRRCADAIRSHCESEDVPARMGGDEFAVLLHADRSAAQRRYRALAETVGASRSGLHTVAASVGVGTAAPGGRLADAVRDADVQMYRHKRERRRRHPEPGLAGR